MHRRLTVLTGSLLVCGLIAASCADGDLDDLAGPTTTSPTSTSTATSSSQTTTSTSTSTTTTPLPAGGISCPRALEPLAFADLDGDGSDEALTIEEIGGVDGEPGGELLVACGSNGLAWTLELVYGVYHLVVADVEPDGTDEVFLGAAGFEWRPGEIDTKLHWLQPVDGALVPYNEDSAGVWVGRSGGAGCVDVDDDGIRELVSLSIDTEASTDEVVVWSREIADARPFEGEQQSDSGEFVVGRDDAAIALLTRFSCGDEVIDPVRIAPFPGICDDESDPFAGDPLRVDLDGDGRDDTVDQREGDAAESLAGLEFGSPAIAACLASGETDELLVGGMGEIFGVSTEPGDRPVVWAGGTTVSAAFSDPIVWEEGRLVWVSDGDGPIGVWDGYQGVDPATGGEWGSWGCADVDVDGELELVQMTAEVDGDEFALTRRGWDIVGGTAVLVAEQFDDAPLPDELGFESGLEILETVFPLVFDCGFLEPE